MPARLAVLAVHRRLIDNVGRLEVRVRGRFHTLADEDMLAAWLRSDDALLALRKSRLSEAMAVAQP
jgi:hypothetical protein